MTCPLPLPAPFVQPGDKPLGPGLSRAGKAIARAGEFG
jgi:hypothetical protein